MLVTSVACLALQMRTARSTSKYDPSKHEARMRSVLTFEEGSSCHARVEVTFNATKLKKMRHLAAADSEDWAALAAARRKNPCA